jgi:lipopolysaccharide export system protein LptC
MLSFKTDLKHAVLLLLLCSAILISFWLVTRLSPTSSTVALLQAPDSFMTNIIATQFNTKGTLHYRLSARETKHFAEEDLTLIQQPFFTFYPESEPAWKIHSDMAKAIYGTKKAWLMGNVFVKQPPGPHSHNLTLNTSIITLYPEKSFAETDQPVTIIQPNSIIHSIGMQIDIGKNAVKFLSHTHGEYTLDEKNHS